MLMIPDRNDPRSLLHIHMGWLESVVKTHDAESTYRRDLLEPTHLEQMEVDWRYHDMP